MTCQCGCGRITRLAPVTDRAKGWTKGAPLRFVKGHNIGGRSGREHWNWKGGRSLSSHGYVVSVDADGNFRRTYEHQLIAEETLGRPLRENEVVHHIDGNKQNNARTNLLICTRAYHVSLHARLRASEAWPQFK